MTDCKEGWEAVRKEFEAQVANAERPGCSRVSPEAPGAARDARHRARGCIRPRPAGSERIVPNA
jgi:hypothetical protein